MYVSVNIRSRFWPTKSKQSEERWIVPLLDDWPVCRICKRPCTVRVALRNDSKFWDNILFLCSNFEHRSSYFYIEEPIYVMQWEHKIIEAHKTLYKR